MRGIFVRFFVKNFPTYRGQVDARKRKSPYKDRNWHGACLIRQSLLVVFLVCSAFRLCFWSSSSSSSRVFFLLVVSFFHRSDLAFINTFFFSSSFLVCRPVFNSLHGIFSGIVRFSSVAILLLFGICFLIWSYSASCILGFFVFSLVFALVDWA